MLTGGKLDIIEISLGAVGVSLEVVVFVFKGVDAVDVHTNRVYAGRVLIDHVIYVGLKGHIIGLNDGIIQKLHFVCADGVYDGVIRIVDVCTVDKLQVVKVERACRLCAHLGAVNIHQTEGHAGFNLEGTCQFGQISLKITPAFPPDAGVLVRPCIGVFTECLGLKGEVIGLVTAGAVRHIASQPEAGVGSVALPLYADSLGSIDPNADGGGHTGNCHTFGGAEAGTLSDCAAVSEVIVELQCVTAKANRLVIVDTYYLGRLHTAAVVVTGVEAAVRGVLAYGVVFLGGYYFTGIGAGIVLKVHNEGGELTDYKIDGGGNAAVKSGGDRNDAAETVSIGGGKGIALKCTELFIGHRPQQVADLVVDVAVLIADKEIELRARAKAEAHFIGAEVNCIGLCNLDFSTADDVLALHHLNGDDALAAACLKETGLCVYAAERCTFLAQSIAQALGHIDDAAAGVNAVCRKLNLGAGGVDFIARADGSVVKFSAGLCRGYQHKTRKRRTLNTVGGTVLERSLVAALALGDKGRGTAAVAADNIHTAEAYHHGGDLIHAHARSNGSLTAVVYHHDQRTVSLYADAGAGSTAAD